jgi:alpha-1,3-glucan synthase
MTEWPAQWQANVWGVNPDGFPDATAAYGDVDGDNVLDRIPPITLEENLANITSTPPLTHLAWWIHINDADLRYWYVPIGSANEQFALYILLLLVPILTALGSVYMYHQSFYQVKHNKFGILDKGTIIPIAVKQGFYEGKEYMEEMISDKTGFITRKFRYSPTTIPSDKPILPNRNRDTIFGAALVPVGTNTNRRRVLIATMEYNIEDWAIKIKIGGLGVMSQLMGQNLTHQDLVWVVPCVGDVEYPIDEPAEDMIVTIFGEKYRVQVQYHQVKNVMYVLLDAPVFRKQTKAEPYPARMDDLESATYYSAWNQCIAETIDRFRPDLYHINDYHGTIAPLYLLPRTLPCCLSLHNAEFQGLWPLRTRDEKEEVASVYNLSEEVISKYVQFGEVFNLLHAGASILRINQQGFGAVGVSTKYGKRAFARYPIFWGLKEIGGLPNPDPTDLADLDTEKAKIDRYVSVDNAYESTRAEPKRQAQEWANLDQRADAELFVFVGRWSEQKGTPLSFDVFGPSWELTMS